MNKRVILGSASPNRREILTATGAQFEVIPADIDEKAIRDVDPALLTTKVAMGKLTKLLMRVKGPAVIITCDQVTMIDGKICEKPESKDEAWSFIRAFSNGYATTVCAVGVYDTESGDGLIERDHANIAFLEIPDKDIDSAIATGTVMQCSGALCIEDPNMQPYLRRLVGTIESVQGLPLHTLRKCLDHIKFDYSGWILPEVETEGRG